MGNKCSIDSCQRTCGQLLLLWIVTHQLSEQRRQPVGRLAVAIKFPFEVERSNVKFKYHVAAEFPVFFFFFRLIPSHHI